MRLVDLPTSTEKIGIDDFLVSSGPDEALSLINNAPWVALPEINASDGDLTRASQHAWNALRERNEPPYLFRFGGRLVRLERDEESNVIAAVLTDYGLRHELASAARWLRPPRKSGDDPAPTKPPLDIVRDMLATPEPPLPVLRGITTAPQLREDGTITPPGYDAESGNYYAADDLEIIRLDHDPTQAEIEAARRLIVEEMLGDFPFASDADRAHAVALLVLPFVRGLIRGPTSLHLIEKPAPGTGATLLSEVLSLPAVGSPIGLMVEGRDDDEWRKRITAKLRSGATFIVVDNVRRPLSSSALASAITATVWEDRLLGSSDQVRLPIRCCWVANGNNPALSNEMARRTVSIRLDAKQDRPWLRSEFRHPNLGEWVTQNRYRIRLAVLVLAKAWYCAGKPAPLTTVRLGMFEDWCRVIGGILDVAGIDGFLANLDQFYADSDSDGEAVRALLQLWWDEFGSTAVGVSSLFPLAEQAGIDLGDRGERSQKTRLGKRLRQLRDTRYTLSEGLTLRLVKAGTVHGSAAVKLVQV